MCAAMGSPVREDRTVRPSLTDDRLRLLASGRDSAIRRQLEREPAVQRERGGKFSTCRAGSLIAIALKPPCRRQRSASAFDVVDEFIVAAKARVGHVVNGHARQAHALAGVVRSETVDADDDLLRPVFDVAMSRRLFPHDAHRRSVALPSLRT